MGLLTAPAQGGSGQGSSPGVAYGMQGGDGGAGRPGRPACPHLTAAEEVWVAHKLGCLQPAGHCREHFFAPSKIALALHIQHNAIVAGENLDRNEEQLQQNFKVKAGMESRLD